MTLKSTEVGSTYKVVKILGAGPLKRRIMDMGITKGTEFYVRKVAPLGDPVQISLRDYELSIRKEDAELIEIEKVGA
ncbi:ferrous iron transport protein A [Peptoniphilus sp. GNH]|nr:FeoA domain protein [Clostridiales bacterium KA00134]UHR02619.1 ferrous iron transport protein A [Peptoniphilus sp. GNH]